MADSDTVVSFASRKGKALREPGRLGDWADRVEMGAEGRVGEVVNFGDLKSGAHQEQEEMSRQSTAAYRRQSQIDEAFRLQNDRKEESTPAISAAYLLPPHFYFPDEG